MYKCEQCHTRIPQGNPAFRKVVETRVVTYPNRQRANKFKRQERRPWPKHWTKEGGWVFTDDQGGTGRDVARELTVCVACVGR